MRRQVQFNPDIKCAIYRRRKMDPCLENISSASLVEGEEIVSHNSEFQIILEPLTELILKDAQLHGESTTNVNELTASSDTQLQCEFNFESEPEALYKLASGHPEIF